MASAIEGGVLEVTSRQLLLTELEAAEIAERGIRRLTTMLAQQSHDLEEATRELHSQSLAVRALGTGGVRVALLALGQEDLGEQYLYDLGSRMAKASGLVKNAGDLLRGYQALRVETTLQGWLAVAEHGGCPRETWTALAALRTIAAHLSTVLAGAGAAVRAELEHCLLRVHQLCAVRLATTEEARCAHAS